MSVSPAYDSSKYHTYEEMAAYLTAWTTAFRASHPPKTAETAERGRETRKEIDVLTSPHHPPRQHSSHDSQTPQL